MEAAKECAPTATIEILGARVAVLTHDVEVTIPERKREAITTELARVLQMRKLTPSDAGKLRDRLGFAQSFIFGKFGRAHLSPFTFRQYSVGRATALNPA